MMLLINGDKAHPMHRLWCYVCIVANIACLVLGIVKNPGIAQRHIDRVLKDQQKKGEGEGDDAEEEIVIDDKVEHG